MPRLEIESSFFGVPFAMSYTAPPYRPPRVVYDTVVVERHHYHQVAPRPSRIEFHDPSLDAPARHRKTRRGCRGGRGAAPPAPPQGRQNNQARKPKKVVTVQYY